MQSVDFSKFTKKKKFCSFCGTYFMLLKTKIKPKEGTNNSSEKIIESDISADKDRVVGYGSWFLYENSKNNYIETFYSKYILNPQKLSYWFYDLIMLFK